MKKRNIFFHRNPRICNICNRPITKKTLNINNFSNNHRALECGCHNTAYHSGGAGGHGAGGAGGHQIFVTVAQFNQFRNMIFQSLIQINGVVNNIMNNVNNLTININNLTVNVNDLTDNVNDLSEDVTDLTDTVNERFDELSQAINNLN